MTPKLDNVDINARVDWQHAQLPDAPPTVEERFPGIAQRFIRQGQRLPDDLALVGFVEGTGATVAAACSNLQANFSALAALRNDGQEHTLRIHNTLYSALVVVEVVSTGPLTAVAVDSGHKAIRAVRLSFRALREAVQEVSE